MLTQINAYIPDVEIHLLTEDVAEETEFVHKIELGENNILFRLIGFVYRMIPYHAEIKRLHEKYRYDLIWHNNVITGFMAAKKIDQVPHVGMINDDNSANVSIKKYGLSHKWLRHKIFKYFEKNSRYHYSSVVVNSIFLEKILLGKYSFTKDIVKVLYKSVDLNQAQTFENQQKQFSNDVIKVIFVKSDYKRGGLAELVNALSSLTYNFKLTIVGPQPNVIEPFILNLNPNNNITFNLKGQLTQQEVFEELSRNDIFCTPSRMEALGVANMEALVQKLAVVYTRTGGIPEVMDYGNNGFEAEANNSQSLAQALEKCIENNVEREAKIEAGWHFVKNNFSKEKMLNNFLKISRDVIGYNS